MHVAAMDRPTARTPTAWDHYMLGWKAARLVVRLKGGPVLFERSARPVLAFAKRVGGRG